MVIETISERPRIALAELAGSSRISRIHTQYKPGNLTNVVSYGIPEKNIVFHLIRSGRECVAYEVRRQDKYSMRDAIQQARTILNEL
ncbi:hypothetical protein TUM3794_19770 [Shewanella colwelliana]|uniref:Uncharacterized protein n=1 Tax=Shewanella colwelliana TaxID=23 RepID=A0ABQ4P073_SHECO|nr:hypothetical protein TUM3794_19770 [Shewanella colwelliana]